MLSQQQAEEGQARVDTPLGSRPGSPGQERRKTKIKLPLQRVPRHMFISSMVGYGCFFDPRVYCATPADGTSAAAAGDNAEEV
jgi:hypothetical protein